MTKLLLIGMMLVLGLFGQLLAQTEANMCVTLTDACCGAAWDSVDYSIPTGKQITKTYIHYDNPSNHKVLVECFGFPNGTTPVLIWDEDNMCNCGTKQTTELHPIGGPNNIRFRVTCTECSGSCTGGNAFVQIYTQPMIGSCPTSCEPD